MAKPKMKNEEINEVEAANVEEINKEETIVMTTEPTVEEPTTEEPTMEEPTMEEPTVEELKARIAVLEAEKEALTKKVSEVKPGRKNEVLEYLMKHGHVRVSKMAADLGITDRNVSSQMTYLRKDGHRIATDSRGYKFLEIDTA